MASGSVNWMICLEFGIAVSLDLTSRVWSRVHRPRRSRVRTLAGCCSGLIWPQGAWVGNHLVGEMHTWQISQRGCQYGLKDQRQSAGAILLGAGSCDYSKVHPMWHVTRCACRRAETWVLQGYAHFEVARVKMQSRSRRRRMTPSKLRQIGTRHAMRHVPLSL